MDCHPETAVSEELKQWQENSRVLRAHLVSYIIDSCERFDRDAAARCLVPVFDKLKKNTKNEDICLSTTNYDRIIEFVCEAAGLGYSDGFEQGNGTVAARWTAEFDSRVHLYKLHGSVTYYLESAGAPGSRFWRLDRGYPLPSPEFRLNRDGHHLEPLMVLPAREKGTSEDPYGQLNHRFAEKMSRTKIVVAVGTSMRDADLVSAFNFNAKDVVLLLVDKEPALARGRLPDVRSVVFKADAVDFFAVSIDRLIELFERCEPGMDRDVVFGLVDAFARGEVKQISQRESMNDEQRRALVVVSSDTGETELLKALQTLRGIGNDGVLEAVAKRCEPANSVLVRKAAAGCLGVSGNNWAVSALREYSIEDASPEVRLEGYLALERLSTEEAASALEVARRGWPEDRYFINDAEEAC